jgi:hypothetical protein
VGNSCDEAKEETGAADASQEDVDEKPVVSFSDVVRGLRVR